MGYPGTARGCREPATPAASPRAPCALSPYIDKIPKPIRRGLGRALRGPPRSGDPEVAGPTPPAASAVLVRAPQDSEWAGPARPAPPRCSPESSLTYSILGGVLAVGLDGWGSAWREWQLFLKKI